MLITWPLPFFRDIGGWSNTKSVIRSERDGLVIAQHTGPVLSSSGFSGFVLSWSQLGVLALYRRAEDGLTDLLCASPAQGWFRVAVESFWVATGSSMSGEWLIMSSATSQGTASSRSPLSIPVPTQPLVDSPCEMPMLQFQAEPLPR